MATTTRSLRRYNHRLRELVRSTGDNQHAIHQGVSRSTAHGWLKYPRTEVVTLAVTDMDVLHLQQELVTLRRRVARLVAVRGGDEAVPTPREPASTWYFVGGHDGPDALAVFPSLVSSHAVHLVFNLLVVYPTSTQLSSACLRSGGSAL